MRSVEEIIIQEAGVSADLVAKAKERLRTIRISKILAMRCAISVHLTCGIWGTLAVGIFSDYSFVTQLIGVAAYGAFALVSAFAIFSLIKVTMGLRVSEEDERRGLDLAEHNMEAYPDYQIVITR